MLKQKHEKVSANDNERATIKIFMNEKEHMVTNIE